MQQFIDNWSANLLAPITNTSLALSIEPAKAALLTGLGGSAFYRLTLVELDGSGAEVDWDVVQVTAVAGGVLTVSRTGTARSWAAGTLIEARLTAAGMGELRDTGGVELGDAAPLALGSAFAGSSGLASREDHQHPAPTPGDIGAATSAQGALADTAVQPADLATVATTGAYADLTGKPTIPSTAAEVGAIATAEKGAANGVATLGSDSKIPLAQLPATAITSTSVVANEAAMLALTAQEGDVAIRPDINTSFILTAEPASTMSNWQEILAPSAGGGAPVGSSTPQPLGTAAPGVSSSASRQDHVHDMPSAADVGADAAGTAAAAVAAHAGTGGAAHANAVSGGAAGFMSGADKAKLDGIAAGATANADTDSLAEGASNKYFTESRVRGAVLTGLSLLSGGAITAADSVLSALGRLQKQITDALAAIAGKQDTLVSGTSLKTVNGNSLLGAGDLAISGGASLAQVVSYAGTAKTLALTDINTVIDCTSGSAVTITIPPQSSETWTADAEIHVRMSGTGTVSIAVGSGVTIPPLAAPIALSGQGAMVTLKRRSSDVWAVVGSVVGGPDVVGPASSVDNEIARFDGVTGKKIKGSASGGAIVGGTALYTSLVVSRLDQSGAGNNDRALMDVQTGAGSARFIYNDPVGPITRGLIVPRTGAPSWWDGSTFFGLFNGEYGGQVIRDTGSLGFGTGSGGTVTQATSKTTSVTLNKPTGRVTMNSAALAAGASVSFTVSNSTVSATDCVICNAGSGFTNYRVETVNVGSSAFNCRVTNVSAGSLSEAVTINFAVIKGAQS